MTHIPSEKIDEAVCLCDFNHNQNKTLRVSLNRCTDTKDKLIIVDEQPKTIAKSCEIVANSTNGKNVVSVKLPPLATQEDQLVSLRRSERNRNPKKMTMDNDKSADLEVKTTKKNSAVISITQMSSILWRELTLQGIDVKIGMVVCAKMTTFWPWPAQVTNFNRNKAHVKFFGDFREGSVPKSQCVPFIMCHHIIFNYLSSIDKKTKDSFRKNVIDSLSAPRLAIRSKPLKHQYLQSVKDVEMYLGSQQTLLSFENEFSQ